MVTTLQARTTDQQSLSIIDIRPLIDGSETQRQTVGEQFRAACRDKGFFYIQNHGIQTRLQARVFAAAKTFFEQPLQIKKRVDKARSPANRGYETLRGQTLEPDAPPDLKEGYYIGRDLPDNHPAVRAGKFNHGANQWPEQTDFRDAMEAYFEAMNTLSTRIMRGIALSLSLPENYFDDFCTDPMAMLRLLHYPPQPGNPRPGEKGCGAHTDFGGITLLLQDDNPGLQVWDQSHQAWIHADPIPGTYVVNLGDMIARWTNDRYRSTLHRVVNISGRERFSIPFFHSGNPDHLVRCLPNCLAPGESPKYAPVTVEQHMINMYQRTYK